MRKRQVRGAGCRSGPGGDQADADQMFRKAARQVIAGGSHGGPPLPDPSKCEATILLLLLILLDMSLT